MSKLTKLQIKDLEITKLKAEIKNLITSKKSFLDINTHTALHRQLEKKTTINKLNTFKQVVDSHTPLVNTLKKVKEEKTIIVKEKANFKNMLKANKKNINFYVSFYIPLGDGKRSNDIIQYKGKEYRGSSRKNGNTGSYFLEKPLTLNTVFLEKQLQKLSLVTVDEVTRLNKLLNF